MFTVTGTTSTYCVLGNPVAHSMSPLMHNTAFRHLGMDAIYLPFEVNDLPAAVSGLKALNIKGASVTHPFKEAIIELVDEIDDTASKIRSGQSIHWFLPRVASWARTQTGWVSSRLLRPYFQYQTIHLWFLAQGELQGQLSLASSAMEERPLWQTGLKRKVVCLQMNSICLLSRFLNLKMCKLLALSTPHLWECILKKMTRRFQHRY